MLVFSRHENERIFIGSDIQITVVAIHGDKVRLGIDAPAGIRCDREEVALRRQREAEGRFVADDGSGAAD